MVTNLFVTPSMQGWVRIDSGNVPLAGAAVLTQGSSATAIPLQAAPMARMAFSQLSDNKEYFTGVALVNGSMEDASITISLIREDGTTVAQKAVRVEKNSKLTGLLGDLVPAARELDGAFTYFESSVPVYATAMFGSTNGRFLANVGPNPPPSGFSPSAVTPTPSILSVAPAVIRPGDVLQISTLNVRGEVQMLLGGQTVPFEPGAPGSGLFFVAVPAIDPGFVNLRLRSDGIESRSVQLRVLSADVTPMETLEGRAFYQKVEVTDEGLDLARPVMVPIRSARVEVLDRSTQAIVSVSETDERGHFRVVAPPASDLVVRVASRLRTMDLRVADNTMGGVLYTIAADIDTRAAPSSLLLADRSRVSGAFNILETIQRGNEAVDLADPRFTPDALTVYWSVSNAPRGGDPREGSVGTTYFNASENIAYVLGDRQTDSDEFDDDVVLHEYAHMLASRFSRDDSPGGAHSIGDMLDPRVAWSEGFANFFSAAVRSDRIYRDASGVNGTRVLRFDLEENVPANDHPGYWSETSVHSLLWDLYDDAPDASDTVGFPLSAIWAAFTDLRNDRFVYLPYFLERFLARNPAVSDIIRGMVQLRSIDFQPNVRPSVTNPFPRRINPGEEVSGEVDSLSTKRHNLVQSSHLMSFTTTGGGAFIRLDVTGLGPGGDENANDLDLFLMDSSGRIIERSDRALNGRSEMISIMLPADTYVIEVRSYYRRAETRSMVFNSGRYRLRVSIQ
jgi:hypothetical protein